MLVDPDILARARRGERDAVVEILSAQYPASHRMAHAINGRPDVGANIVNWVMKRSFNVIESWADEAAPERWFRHHTLLTTRRASRWKPDATSGDTLLSRDEDRSESAFVAFVRALRSLPHQQMEAFLLTHGEGLDLRSTAVGMDLSTTAAANHLKEAEKRLRELAGEQYDSLVARIRDAYAQLAPSKDLAMQIVARDARRRLWPRKLRRILRVSVVIALLALLGWLAYRWWPRIVESARSLSGT